MAAGKGPSRTDDPKELYATLGMPSSASTDEIRKAYRRLALRWHPDKNPDDPAATEQFQKISASYEVLSDAKRRELYDTTGCIDAEELAEAGDLDHAGDLFAAFFMGMDEDLDPEDQAMLDEFLRFTGGAAFRRKGRGRRKKGTAGAKSSKGTSSRGNSSFEVNMLDGIFAAMAGVDGPLVAEPQCPQGHNLKRRKVDEVYECDICSADIAANKRFFDCRKCDYSVCQRCHKKLAAQAEAEAEAALIAEDPDEEEMFEVFCEMSTTPARDGQRLKFCCEYCKELIGKQSEVAAHMRAKHSEEFEAFAEGVVQEVGGPGGMPGMLGMPAGGLENLLLEEMMRSGMGFEVDSRPAPGPRRSKKKR